MTQKAVEHYDFGRALCGIAAQSGGTLTAENGAMFVPRFQRSFLGKQGAAFVSGERKRFEGALIEARGNRDKAAEILNVSRATFFRRAKELGIIHGRRPSPERPSH